jgi:hypothetical protein
MSLVEKYKRDKNFIKKEDEELKRKRVDLP